MALKRRGKSEIWQIDFTPPGGQRIRRSSGTINKAQAQELEDTLKNKHWRYAKLNEKPPMPWTQAVVRWLKEKERDNKKNLIEDKRVLKWLDQYWRYRTVNEIDSEAIEDIVNKRIEAGNLQKTIHGEWRAVSNATINRLLEVIRGILYKCVKEWSALDKCPTITMLKEENERIRWITCKEAARLLKQLLPHAAAMTRFAVKTGLRESNVTRLKWEPLDLKKRRLWKNADEMKNKTAHGIPLSRSAIIVLKKELGKHPLYVFTYEGEPIKKAHTDAWDKAVERAGITDFKWHDLRHTWASWHIQRGTPLPVLKELGGWKTLTMVLRYAHLNTDHLSKYV